MTETFYAKRDAQSTVLIEFIPIKSWAAKMEWVGSGRVTLRHVSPIPYGQKTRTRLDSRGYDPAMAQASACLLFTPSCILDAEGVSQMLISCSIATSVSGLSQRVSTTVKHPPEGHARLDRQASGTTMTMVQGLGSRAPGYGTALIRSKCVVLPAPWPGQVQPTTTLGLTATS